MIAAITKVHAKHGKLLKQLDYLNLLNLKNLQAIKESICTHDIYSKISKSINLVNFENKLKENMMEDLQSISLYLGKEKSFYDSYISKNEIRALKTYIRAINTNNTSLIEALYKTIYSKSLNFVAINIGLSAYISSLKGTRYYRALQAFEHLEQNKDFDIDFYIAMSMDNFYYRNCLDEAKKLNNKQIMDYIASLIDIYNLEYLYRTKSFYSVYTSELSNYLILGGKNFTLEKLKMLNNLDVNGFIAAIKESSFAKHLHNIDSNDEYIINNDFERFKYNMADKAFRNTGQYLLQLVAYTDLLDFQTRDILRILELNKVDISQKKSMLIRSLDD